MIISGSVYSLPQVLRSIQRGCSKGVSAWFIGLWLLDKTLSLAYVSHLGDTPLIIKYTFGLMCVLIIAWYKRID